MVHALKEAHRVLVPHGTMIDMRPLSVIVPLEVVYEGGSETAGMADMTPGVKFDIAAEQAIESVVKEGIFQQSSLETLDYVYYWKTYHGMVVHFEEKWQDEIVISKDVLDKARRLYQQKLPKTRLRLPIRGKLAKFEKQG